MPFSIFIYDDMRAQLASYAEAFKRLDWDVVAVRRVEEASKIISDREFDVYVLDLLEKTERGTHASGLDLLRMLDPKKTKRKVIVLTASTDVRHADRVSDLGASFVMKRTRIRETCARLVPKAQEAAEDHRRRELLNHETSSVQTLWRGMAAGEVAPIPGLSVHVLVQPKYAVGGDFCWALTNETKDTLTVFLADTVGKGPTAALLSAFGMASVELAGRDLNSDDVLTELLVNANQKWWEITQRLAGNEAYFITGSAVRLQKRGDHWSGSFAFCGGEPIALYNEGEYKLLPGSSLPLGLEHQIQPVGYLHTLTKGALVVMVTDGLTGTGNPDLSGMNSEEWLAKLKQILQPNLETELGRIAEAIVGQFSTEPATDDRSVILIRCE